MAKSCMVNREIKRIRLAKKFSTKRTELKAVIKNMSLRIKQQEVNMQRNNSQEGLAYNLFSSFFFNWG